MECAVVLFNRDLRVHDHPALHAAVGAADHVVPLFVLDPALLDGAVNRVKFLLDCLADLRASLRDRGGDLLVTRGDAVDETMRVARKYGAEAVFATADVTSVASRRESRLAAACASGRMAWRACRRHGGPAR